MTTTLLKAGCTTATSARVYHLVRRISALPDVKIAVEANHDENQWWPTTVADPRMRMAAAGWSARVSYAMVATYARVIAEADAVGFDTLIGLSDADLSCLLGPLGLLTARLGYLRSLAAFLERHAGEADHLLNCCADEFVGTFAAEVEYASFKIAQCAALYSRGYHCGIIPVDSGMVTKLAPAFGIDLPRTPIAHEQMRHLLQACLAERPREYRHLIRENGYAITLPADADPSWWLHLVLIYFKRLYLNVPCSRLCQLRPMCHQVVDCVHAC